MVSALGLSLRRCGTVSRIRDGNDGHHNLRDECLTKTVDLMVKADMSIGATETARTNEKCILAVALVYGYPTDLREFAASQAVVAPMTRDLISCREVSRV